MPTKTIAIRYLNAYAPPILWAGFIFILSSQQVLPGITVSGLDFILKKTAHMFVYGVLFLLFQRGMIVSKGIQLNYEDHSFWVIPALVALIYAGVDEFHQSLVPGRYATLRDVGYDMTGVLLAFLKRYQYI